MASSLAPGMWKHVKWEGAVSVEIIDDASGRRREDLEAKTGIFL